MLSTRPYRYGGKVKQDENENVLWDALVYHWLNVHEVIQLVSSK